jgi:lipoprotein-anchoring transpeptidase ErfK/SrfK
MSGELRIEIDIGAQRLSVLRGADLLKEYRVSTAKNGAGERMETGCTPRGRHVIAEKVGDGCEPGAVFVGRRPTGEIYTPELRRQHPARDWILTRILWLSGAEPGLNQGGEVDTYNRYIYIHGAPDDVPMGTPGSAGCIRMRNADVIELFDRIPPGTPVEIRE